MTTKAKNKGGNQTRKKLALNKETLRDLSARKADHIRGGIMDPDKCSLGKSGCFGTPA